MTTQIRQHTTVSKTSNNPFTLHRRSLRAMLAFTALVCLCAGSAIAQVKQMGDITSFTIQGPQSKVDYVNAKAMPLPSNNSQPDSMQATIQALMSSIDMGPTGGSSASQGSGVQSPVFLGTPAKDDGGVLPPDFGTSNHPFTTVRADLSGLNTNTAYPYRAAGKLFFKIGASSYLCSASLIKPGIVVTAAHCVANYGQKQFYTGLAIHPRLSQWRSSVRRVGGRAPLTS